MRQHPHLYEVNARILLRRLSEKYRRPLTLTTIPDEEWQSLVRRGFDFVWLMGVWQRSPGARKEALLNVALRHEYDRVLPDWTEEDVAGSPYAVYNYQLDSALGKPGELAELRSKLNRLGLKLMADFVPNHLAFDHPWVSSHPEWFVQGKASDVKSHPDWFFSPAKGVYLAHGRDPNFPSWSDTVQVNVYSRGLREAMTDELLRVVGMVDGVRCDMAMLLLNDVFEQIWGGMLEGFHRPETEFWQDTTGQVKRQWPDSVFLAEVYWGYEWKLQQLGFDFTKDKVLYDRLRCSTAEDVRGHLRADELFQRRSARFIENHDELRAVVAFGRERSMAAAVVLATILGLRVFHDGMLEGRRIRLPVQLVREPPEPPDTQLMHFYDRLLAITNAPAFHDGKWQLLEASPVSEENLTYQNLLSWSWHYRGQSRIVVVNLSPEPAQGWLRLPPPSENAAKVIFLDELTGATYIRDPGELRSRGLYVALGPYQSHILDMTVG
ncbi:MAG: hypothetical protein HY665_02405 [Chloroflexi bacterium]|nr:hypothetical protein [Chloroflexota bacterium]